MFLFLMLKLNDAAFDLSNGAVKDEVSIFLSLYEKSLSLYLKNVNWCSYSEDKGKEDIENIN